MTIAGDLQYYLKGKGLTLEESEEAVDYFLEFLMSADVLSYLSKEECHIEGFIDCISSLRTKMLI